MKITEHIEMLEIEAGHGKIYPTLIHDENHLVLVDTGFAHTTADFEKAVKLAGYELSDLTEILLTHQDLDHIGGANNLKKMAPNVKILAPEIDAPFIQGDETPTKLAKLEAKKADGTFTAQDEPLFEFLNGGFSDAFVKVDEILTDGKILDIAGGIEVIFTPGHTPGHAVYLVKSDNTLIVGDAANVIDGELTGSNPPMTWNMEKAEASLQKIKALNATNVISYHTGFLKN